LDIKNKPSKQSPIIAKQPEQSFGPSSAAVKEAAKNAEMTIILIIIVIMVIIFIVRLS
jgi:t-SNARE complex subunit (syntaxin)